MEREEVDKCVALESVAKQDNGKKDSMIAEPRNHQSHESAHRYILYIYTYTHGRERDYAYNNTASHMRVCTSLLDAMLFYSYGLI